MVFLILPEIRAIHLLPVETDLQLIPICLHIGNLGVIRVFTDLNDDLGVMYDVPIFEDGLQATRELFLENVRTLLLSERHP